MMLLHYVRLAFKSMRRNPILSSLIVGAIALGITISTSFITLYHVMAQDPIPDKSSRLHYIRMDNWDPARPYPGEGSLAIPPQITFQDMRNIMKSTIPVRQTATYRSNLFVFPDPKQGRPFRAAVRLAFSDFFTMFEVPFQYGGPWDKSADEKPEQVVVLDQETNDKVFGGGNSVGRTLRIDEREFKVVGVLAHWRPIVKMYDLTSNQTAPPEGVFMPFNLAEPMEIRTAGNTDNWKPIGDDNSYAAVWIRSEMCWLQMWVELADDGQKQAYVDFLQAYVTDQKKLGRFQRKIDNRVTSLPALMVELQVVPRQIGAMASISLLFLAVCSLNLMGLLLGKFLARAPEVGVRRALGASRTAIFLQHIVECELIGVLGGVIGLALSLGVLALFNRAIFGIPIALDLQMVGAAVVLSLVAGLVAGLYPAWRICTIPPASYLRLG
jgi:putative ABC transport system permease protein